MTRRLTGELVLSRPIVSAPMVAKTAKVTQEPST